MIKKALLVRAFLSIIKLEFIMNKEKVLLTISIVILAIGIILNFINFGSDNTEIAQQAMNAQEAAIAISTNNRMDILVNAISLFLIGLGGLLTALTVLKILKNKR